jgi:Domain of unknown function (DUF4253)
MATSGMPEEGELRLGAVTLPAGRRVVPMGDPGEPVAWVTAEPVPDAGPVWSALWAAHGQTGLVPVLLTGSEKDEDFFFYGGPADLTALDDLDAAALLAEWWERKRSSDEEEDPDHMAAVRGPFSSQFPGLAPREDTALSMAQLYEVLRSLPGAPIGLVPARRAADVLATVGWCTTDQFQSPLPIAAVLRSWEARYGARLLALGPGAQIQLLVERPPRTTEAAQAIAAEHLAFCDECAGQGLRDIPGITASLVNAPTWTFWWD